MTNCIVIIGAGGHGRVIADTALLSGYKDVVFLDDAEKCEVEISGKTDDFVKYLNNCDFFVAIGNNKTRAKITDKIKNSGAAIVSLIHPSAVIGSNVVIGKGSFVAPGAIINTGAVIGDGVILNTASSVDHDCRVGDFSHVSIGSRVAGTVQIGKGCFIGAGAVIINNTTICEACVIGAGSVVVKDVVECGTYVGVPARKIKD